MTGEPCLRNGQQKYHENFGNWMVLYAVGLPSISEVNSLFFFTISEGEKCRVFAILSCRKINVATSTREPEYGCLPIAAVGGYVNLLLQSPGGVTLWYYICGVP